LALILCIETATDVCSVALAQDGILLAIAESDEPKSHAGTVVTFIEKVMNESNLKLSQLDAVSISKGPGSYTGLRIGTATAKGLCYALEKPLIAINTLQSMTSYLIESRKPNPEALLVPLIDARRMEVYSAVFDAFLNEITVTKAEIISEKSFSELLKKNKAMFFGDGSAKCKSALHPNSNAFFEENFKASAIGMLSIAEKSFKEKKFENIAYFEPFYLKDFVGINPKS
jgi:tRNA threonylcarbamoyladenosine biosynthesis protein TsaB